MIDESDIPWTWICPGCSNDQEGCMWGSRGVCYDCHMDSLLPPDSGDEYVGLSRVFD